MLMIVKTSCLRIHEGNCLLDPEGLDVNSLLEYLDTLPMGYLGSIKLDEGVMECTLAWKCGSLYSYMYYRRPSAKNEYNL